MKTKDQATPRPWDIHYLGESDLTNQGWLIRHNHTTLAIVRSSESDARLIVKAVNKYDQNQSALKSYEIQANKDALLIKELVEALKLIISVKTPQIMMDGNSKMGDKDRVNWNYAIIAKQALAKAGAS